MAFEELMVDENGLTPEDSLALHDETHLPLPKIERGAKHVSALKKCALDETLTLQNGAPYKGKRRPINIGCSGGGGHIAAIKGIEGEVRKRFPDAEFLSYKPTPISLTPNIDVRVFHFGARIMHPEGLMTGYLASTIVQPILKYSPIPDLPCEKDLKEEMESLSNAHERTYIDMLLDVYPAGYEYAAAWNINQRHGNTDALKKMIKYQSASDARNYERVKQYFLSLLEEALRLGRPYTEIYSTQAMALSGLCQAVYQYNKVHSDKPIPKVIIHQYMTDLPTKGAVHFFDSINSLLPHHRAQMILYGRGFSEGLPNIKRPEEFHAVYDIPASDNPMVRPGFKERETSLHEYFNAPCEIPYKAYDYTEEDQVLDLNITRRINIMPSEKVASIMLGSQAGTDIISYVRSMLLYGFDKIFVFGAYKGTIYHEIDAVINRLAEKDYDDNQRFLEKINTDEWPPSYLKQKRASLTEIKKAISKRVIRLGNQSAAEMQPIMTRSNTIIMGSGGLSVMEGMAMEHNINQSVFIHRVDPVIKADSVGTLSSGISWEDENGEKYINFLKKKGVYSRQTTPSFLITDLDRAQDVLDVATYLEEDDITSRATLIKRENDVTLTFSTGLLINYPADKRKAFIQQIVSNPNLLKGLNQLVLSSKIRLSYPLLELFRQNERLINLSVKGGIHHTMVLHLLSAETDGIVKFKSVRHCLHTLYSFYRDQEHYRIIYSDEELKKIRDSFFKTILSQGTLDNVIFALILSNPILKPFKEKILNDLLIYQCENIQSVYADQAYLLRNSACLPVIEPDKKKSSEDVKRAPSVEDKKRLNFLLSLDYLITRNYFKTGILSTGFFEGIFGGEKISYINEAGKKEFNIVPKNMKKIHVIVQDAIKDYHSDDAVDALVRIKKIISDRVSSHFVRKEYYLLDKMIKDKEAAHDITLPDIVTPSNLI